MKIAGLKTENTIYFETRKERDAFSAGMENGTTSYMEEVNAPLDEEFQFGLFIEDPQTFKKAIEFIQNIGGEIYE